MMERIRTFIALEIPIDLKERLGHLQQALKQLGIGARWVRPENIHLTLKFIGDTPETEIDKISAALLQAASLSSPMVLNANSIGIFPNIRKPRVLWAGLEGQVEELCCLQRELDVQLETLGFKRDKKPFRGHLTLGRFKQGGNVGPVSEAVQKYQDTNFGVINVNDIALFLSDLKPSGPVYKKLASAALT